MVAAVELFEWKNYRRAFKWRDGAAGWGQHVLDYPRFDANSITGQMMLLPPGQSTPTQVALHDTVVLGVQGEVEFSIGDDRTGVGALDLLGIARSMSYRAVNNGLVNALVFCMSSKQTGGETATVTAPAGPVHMRWLDYRNEFRWGLPFAERWGFHRGAGPHLRLDSLSGHTVRHPLGQSSPWHAPARDLLFIQLQGSCAFQAAGKVWDLAPWDVLVVRAHTPYSYTNVGLEESIFLDMGIRTAQGSTYYAEDPGWPVRADARVLKTEKDAHGQARLAANAPSSGVAGT